MKQTELPWWVLPSLGAAVLVIFATALALAFIMGNETQETTMLTATVTLATGVVGYYYGSSASSAKKDAALANAAGPTAPPSGGATP